MAEQRERDRPMARAPSTAPSARRVRDLLAVVVALAFCLALGGRSVAELVRGRSTIPADTAEVAAIGALYEAIAPALPAAGHVGFFSDRPLSDLLGAREYILAQLFLAPRVVDYERRRLFAVGRFETREALEEHPRARGYEVVGGGPAPAPYVLRRRDRKAER